MREIWSVLYRKEQLNEKKNPIKLETKHRFFNTRSSDFLKKPTLPVFMPHSYSVTAINHYTEKSL